MNDPALEERRALSPWFDRPLSDAERRLLDRVTMFGSDAYPITKVRGGWIVGGDGTAGVPGVFKTRRKAVEAFERFYDVLLDARAGEAYRRALAEQAEKGAT